MQLPENLRTLITPDGAMVTDIEQGLIFGINPVGSLIWQQLTQGRSPEDIARRLVEDFDITMEQANADVGEFLQHLEALHLLNTKEKHDLNAIQLGNLLPTFLQKLRTRIRRTTVV